MKLTYAWVRGVLALAMLAGCAHGPVDQSLPPPAGDSAPLAPSPPTAGAPSGPPTSLPDAEACVVAYREKRYDVIHRNADALLPFIADPAARLMVLFTAACSDVMCRDFTAASVHASDYQRERRNLGGDKDSMDAGTLDAGILVVTGMTRLALADGEEDLNQARLLLGGVRLKYPSVDDLPWLPEIQVASYAVRPCYFHRAYSGKYASDGSMSRGWAALETALPGAMERVRARLGKPDLVFPPLAVRIEDGEPTRKGFFMVTQIYTVRREPVAVVTVFSEHLRAGRTRCEDDLAHELVHAVKEAAGPSPGEPAWLDEGLAHWVSRDDEEEIRTLAMTRIISDPLRAEESMARLMTAPAALARESAEIQRHAGAHLFFFIERSRGFETTRRLAVRLLENRDSAGAFRDILGAEPEAVFEEARREAPAWFRRSFPGWNEVSAIFELVGAGKNAEAVAHADLFVAKGGSDRETFIVRIARVLALRNLKRWDAAVADIRKLQEDPVAGFAMPSFRYGEVKYLREAGRWEEVVQVGKEALRDIVWDDDDEGRRAEIEKWVKEAEGKKER